jgi:hypothetical protein
VLTRIKIAIEWPTLKHTKEKQNMSKVTIAAAVLAGLTLSDRLVELGVQDEAVFKVIGDLAGALGEVMAVTEKVDLAVGLVSAAQLADDEDTVMRGLAAIKAVTSDLVSDQDKIMAAMLGDMSEEEALMMRLLAELGAALR